MSMISAAVIATIIYLILTLAALLSIISPVLQSISSHGKTRTLTRTINNTQHEHKKFIHQRLLYFVLSSPRLTINKCRFIDFYTIGIITTTSRLAHTTITYYYDTDITYIVNKQQLVVPILLLIHLFRRYCECKWVQKSTSSTSCMHLAGYLLGILHYICLPFILIPHHTLLICTNDDEYKDSNGAKPFDIQQSTLLEIFSIIGCLYFQYQQYRHHVLLANLRRKTKKTETKLSYLIPVGGWFEHISCPHYFSEIMIYVVFSLLVHGNTTDLTEQWNDTQSIMFGDAIATLHMYKHWILLLWVTTNLSISANRNHQWYINNFREAYPQHRKRLIPCVW